jgi:SAM-dependent methyltransferase
MIQLACPRCHTPLEEVEAVTKRCSKDGLTFQRLDGIWRMLLPEREEYFAPFVREYETVRRGERRGSGDKAYYNSLPYRDLTGTTPHGWKIRAASFDAFLERVLEPMEKELSRPLRVLDLGAGNGWLSNRLAFRGHDVAAVDLTVNDFDGLGCHRFYESAFLPVQAEFDHLPFAEASAEAVVFNASLHYSVDIERTLREALTVLDARGVLVILDSPFYRDGASGARMVAEREAQFRKQYGFASDSLPSENYLTYARLNELGNKLKLNWESITPFYGLRWSLRPLLAFLLRRREPAKFHVIAGRRSTA